MNIPTNVPSFGATVIFNLNKQPNIKETLSPIAAKHSAYQDPSLEIDTDNYIAYTIRDENLPAFRDALIEAGLGGKFGGKFGRFMSGSLDFIG